MRRPSSRPNRRRPLAAPETINTLPDKTLLAFAEHGRLSGELSTDSADAEATLAEFAQAGVDEAVLAEKLLREGTQSFDSSWASLMQCIASKARVLGKSAPVHASVR